MDLIGPGPRSRTRLPEADPELELKLSGGGQFAGPDGHGPAATLGPVVRLGDDVELGCRNRLADPPHLELGEPDPVVADAVEPAHRRAVFVSEALGDPHDRDGIQACGVREDLAGVGMIGDRELILDEDV